MDDEGHGLGNSWSRTPEEREIAAKIHNLPLKGQDKCAAGAFCVVFCTMAAEAIGGSILLRGLLGMGMTLQQPVPAPNSAFLKWLHRSGEGLDVGVIFRR
jgi:hypothetical protein